MSQDDARTAAEAREGLTDGIAGKAKEVFGAVTGRGDLVEEGQLQQEEARHRKAANADEAVAKAKRDEAARELRETSTEAAEERQEAHEDAALAQGAIDRRQAEEHESAERAAERQEAVGTVVAEQRADELAEQRVEEAEDIAEDADRTEERAAAEQVRLEREAALAEQQAARLRAETESKG